MKITFLSLKGTLDYFRIGGVESYVRRMAVAFLKQGNEVNYVIYGNSENKEVNVFPGLTVNYFKNFNDALDSINDKYDHVVSLYLSPKDRLSYVFFRRKFSLKTRFHLISFGLPQQSFKKHLVFLDAKLYPYNGKIFFTSKEQHDYFNKKIKNTYLVMPPVPEDYFLTPEEKTKNSKINLSFIGRLSADKGITELIELFKILKNNDKFQCCICGVYSQEDEQSMKIHELLKAQKEIKYCGINGKEYSEQAENLLKEVLKVTDITIQPYRDLSRTINPPLLLLEAMAGLCAVITKPIGDIAEVYGKSDFLSAGDKGISKIAELLKKITYEEIVKERYRIYEQNNKLKFSSSDITREFIDAIKR